MSREHHTDAKRGFAIAVPGLSWPAVPAQLQPGYTKPPEEDTRFRFRDEDMHDYFDISVLRRCVPPLSALCGAAPPHSPLR